MSMKRFTFEECLWYFKYLQKEFAIGTFVKYRHIGNGHYPELWGYERHRRGEILDWLRCDNPYYLFKVKIKDLDNKQYLTIHTDLIESLTI